MQVIHRNSYEISTPEYNKWHVIMIEMWVIMLSGPSVRLPFHTVERIFIATCLAVNLIIAGTFQVNLI